MTCCFEIKALLLMELHGWVHAPPAVRVEGMPECFGLVPLALDSNV
jgi:hypothetical protein